MGPLLPLFGAILGFGLSRGGDIGRIVMSSLGALVLFWYAFRSQKLWRFVVPFGVSLCLGLILFYVPIGLGKGEISGFVVKTGDNYYVVEHLFLRYYVSSSGHGHEVGDYVSLKGTLVDLKMTSYESRFDFASYLKDMGVRAEITSYKETTLFQNPFRLRAYELRFLSHFEGDTKALLDSLLFGKKDYSSSLIDKASEMNLLFVLSTSGFFYSLFLRSFERILPRKIRKYSDVIALFVGAAFLPFGFAKVGILRVYLMRLIKCLDARVLHKDLPYLWRLCLAMGLLLFFDFRLAIQTGFLSGLGISLFTYFGSRLWQKKNKILTLLLGMISIRLFLLPMSVSSGGGIHLFGVVFSLVLMPLSLLTLALGYLSFFTFPFTHVLGALGQATSGLVHGFSHIDLSIPLPVPSFVFVVVFYLVVLAVIYFSETGFQKARNVLLLAILGVYCVSLIPIVPALSESVSFINVGQGDCALIQDGLTTVMIDTGGIVGMDLANESLIPYLRKRRIYHIDCVIASHQDYDHVGALSSLQSSFDVRRYVKDKAEFPLNIGRLRFENYNVYDATEENDKSLVLFVSFMDRKWTFTGDAPKWVERRIVGDNPSLDCDVIKVGHHGSDTSTSDEFLDALTPEEAVISCGAKNKFGHPKPSVIAALEKRGIKIRRTDLEGTITYARMRRWA